MPEINITPQDVDTIIYDALNGTYLVQLTEDNDCVQYRLSAYDAKELMSRCERYFSVATQVYNFNEPAEELDND